MFLPNLEHRSAVLRRCSQMKYSTSMLVDWSYPAIQKYMLTIPGRGCYSRRRDIIVKLTAIIASLPFFNKDRGNRNDIESEI